MSDKVYFVDSVALAIAHAQSMAQSRYGQIGLIRKVGAGQIVSKSRIVKVLLQFGETREWFIVEMEKTETGWAILSDNKEKIMKASKLEKMSIVKKVLTDGEFAVRALFWEELFRVVGGEEMLALIEEEDDSYELWKLIGVRAGELKSLNTHAAGVIESLAMYVQSDDERLTSWGKEGALVGAIHDLADFVFARKAECPYYGVSEAFAKFEAIAQAAASVKEEKDKLLAEYGDGKGYIEMHPGDEGAADAWGAYVSAAYKLEHALHQEAHEAHDAVLAYWIPIVMLDDARRVARSFPVGEEVGGYIQVEDYDEEEREKYSYIALCFFGNGDKRHIITEQVFNALEAEGLIEKTGETRHGEPLSSGRRAEEGTLFIYKRIS